MTTELYYKVHTADRWDGNYQHATIQIFEVNKEEREWNDRYYPGDMHVSDDNRICTLSYQRDRTRDVNGNETSDPDKRMISLWYAEDITNIRQGFMSLSVDKIERLAKIIRRMDKAHDRISSKGLTVQNGNDQFTLRVFLLKEIGARELGYANHQLYHMGSVPA